MYRIGRREKKIRHHVGTVLLLFILVMGLLVMGVWVIVVKSNKTEVKQSKSTVQEFDPTNTKNNLKIDTELYTMELPSDWKEISRNADTRYNSIKWQMQSGIKNRWIELFTDRMPVDTAFNRIIPVTISLNRITASAESDNCVKFTQPSGASLKVPSKWQDAPFLCDMSNKTDNIVGVSEEGVGTIISLTGATKGAHTYMFIYTDRGIPEDQTPILKALNSLSPK